jgi:arabinose-5-phosphate isomerase
MKHDYNAIAKETLKIEGTTLIEAAGLLDLEIETAVEIILTCKGKLIVTGVGKSGLIGAKIAATLASTGTPSFFLHPTEALHGDLGMIGRDDVVLAISYSGESEELSKILPHIKRFDIPLIGMTRTKNSTLGQFSDVIVPLHVKREACPLDVAPTSSTTLTLALGDALAICLMKARNFAKEDFASYHPGGTLGRQLFVKVKDLMRTQNLPIVSQTTSLKEAIVTISEGRLGTVLIVDEDEKLVALVSDGDIRRALIHKDFSLDHSVMKYATHHPKTLDDATLLASDALVMIENYKIQLLIITDKDNKIQGVLHLHDLVEAGIK